MRRGKMATEEANWDKTARQENERLLAVIVDAQEGSYETDDEIKTLPLEEVSKRLKEIYQPVDNPYKGFSDWTDLDRVRWQRLSWRARRLGVFNPFSLLSN